MARINISCPKVPTFFTQIPVLVEHINYGGHLANDAVLSILHEARIRFLQELGCREKDACGVGLIMTDSAIVYKNEGFQGDMLEVAVVAYDVNRIGFDLYYQVSCKRNNEKKIIAEAKTGMVCFNYENHKPMRMPDKLKGKLMR